MNENVYVVIMAGGGGTRFWPLSKKVKPKQFLSITQDGDSMIKVTSDRGRLLSNNAQYVLTNKNYKDIVKEHLKDAKQILEPVSKNTAPPIGLGALYLLKENKDAVMVVLPSDHVIKNLEKMKEVFQEAIDVANEKKALVTIGIDPTYPHTGYGYIKSSELLSGNTYKVERFVEKPKLEVAKEYVESKQFYWNSGMFVWRADVILNEIKNCMPDLYNILQKIDKYIGTKDEQKAIEEYFPQINGESIDFGVMEKSSNVYVVKAQDLGWNDVGSLKEWSENFKKDTEGNVILSKNIDNLAINTKDSVCILENEALPTFLIGLDNVIVVNTGKEVLVCNKEKAQDVKILVEKLKSEGKEKFL